MEISISIGAYNRVDVVGITDYRSAVGHPSEVQAHPCASIRRNRCDCAVNGSPRSCGRVDGSCHDATVLPIVVGDLLIHPVAYPVHHSALLQVECRRLSHGVELTGTAVDRPNCGGVSDHGTMLVEVCFEREVKLSGAVPWVDAIVAKEVVLRAARQARDWLDQWITSVQNSGRYGTP